MRVPAPYVSGTSTAPVPGGAEAGGVPPVGLEPTTFGLKVRSSGPMGSELRHWSPRAALARNVWRGGFAAAALARALSVPSANLGGVPERRRTDVSHRFRCVAVATCDIAAECGSSHVQVGGALLHSPLFACDNRCDKLFLHPRLPSHVAPIIQHRAVNYSTVMLWQR